MCHSAHQHISCTPPVALLMQRETQIEVSLAPSKNSLLKQVTAVRHPCGITAWLGARVPDEILDSRVAVVEDGKTPALPIGYRQSPSVAQL